MAHSSHSKGSVSVDLFNLPTLPDKRRVATSYLDIPVNFYLPDRKNSKISKIVSRQSFDRQTPDGNEGFVIEIQYLRRAFGTKTYLIDKVTGSLFALHNDHIESTGFCGTKCVFDLQELEFHICDLADRRNGEEDIGSIAEERQTSHVPQHQTSDVPPSPGPPMIPDNFPMYEEWENLTHQGVLFTISYRQQIYEGHSEIITTLTVSVTSASTLGHTLRQSWHAISRKHVNFLIIHGSYSTLMFYRKITFSGATMSYQNYQHLHTPHLSMTWRQFTESTSCHMHGENRTTHYKRLQ